MRYPPHYEQAWTRALERAATTPGAYELLLALGKNAYIEALIQAEKKLAKQTRRYLRDTKETVRSNKQTAESVDYSSKEVQNASITGGSFCLLSPPENPTVVPRKKDA